MITYENTLFGFSLIFRVHGSAVWKASLPALFSTALLLLYLFLSGGNIQDKSDYQYIKHAYVVTAYIAFFSFLLTFRLNFAYQRYWEGATAVELMLSKWLDVATMLAAFHYQCEQYDKYRPPAFGQHVHLRNITKEREREHELTKDETMEQLKSSIEAQNYNNKHPQEGKRTVGSTTASTSRKRKVAWQQSLFRLTHLRQRRSYPDDSSNSARNKITLKKNISSAPKHVDSSRIPTPRTFQEQFSISAAVSKQNGLRQCLNKSYGMASGLTSTEPIDIPYPSLFLQETAHLVSLLSGVALSTLRNDIEGADSPLAEYFPGQPWPAVDPDQLSTDVRRTWESSSRTLSALYFLLGLTRDDRHRTLYNAARPFQILGGVSDGEIQRLNMAHGPYAKVALCTMYLREFVAREYQSGSTGKVHEPIISRITHVLSDGMAGYNQSRKLAYNPFPFPHAQMTAFFTIATFFIFPLLYYGFVNNLPLACILNFVTVLCFMGIHEVARELENPMRNVPNDLPLTTFQAEFNEALVTIYAGFHPDSWWIVDDNENDNIVT